MDTSCPTADVMLVCRNGHVITERLHGCPDQALRHCDRCGADTLSACPTCGQQFPGAVAWPGPLPIGRPQPPLYCAQCGAALPWAPRPRPAADPLAALETLLRRLPLVVRQLRSRQGDRPPFRVEDEHDLEDLLRALLAVPFDDIRPEGRTPAYTPGRRTDFLLDRGALAVTVKCVRAAGDEPRLAAELAQDAAYYQARPTCRTLVCFLYDPEGRLPDPRRLEAAWSRQHDDLDVRCVSA
jgi:hypothetical protein